MLTACSRCLLLNRSEHPSEGFSDRPLERRSSRWRLMHELRIAGRDFGRPMFGKVFATIYRGGRICLLKPSGVGKATLLKAIAGLDKSVANQTIIGRDRLRGDHNS